MAIDALTLDDDPAQAIEKINQHDNAGTVGQPVTSTGIASKAVTTEKLADAAVTTEKLANGAVDSKNLTQDLANALAQSGNGGANSPDYFSRDIPFSASNQLTVATPNRLWINIAKNGYALESQKTYSVVQDASWDSQATLWQANHDYAINDVIYPAEQRTGYYYRCTTAGKSSTLTPSFPATLGETYNDGNVVWICELDYTVAANRAGKDFYIYACMPTSGVEPTLLLSVNSTVPLNYTADNSRKIGGFHCLCADVGVIDGHPLSNYVAGDILPASVWDLAHRPKSDPEGMAYIDGIDLWVDIYLASWTGAYSNTPEGLKLVSKYNAVCADGTSSEKFHCYKFDQVYGRQNKRLLRQQEFVCASIGSNQGTAIVGAKDQNTTGGFKDTAGRRMISNFGLEDCCGNLWQWGAEIGQTSSGSWVAATDANDKYVGGNSYTTIIRALFGGSWSGGSDCGSRASAWNYGALYLGASFGARGASEPLH